MLAGTNPRLGDLPGWKGIVPRTLAWIGVYSYTIYLTHSVVYELPFVTRFRFFMKSAFPSFWLDPVVFVLASIASGFLVSHIIERPFLRLRGVWFPSIPAGSAHAGRNNPLKSTINPDYS
jgi:peptidoglycan/LPS O-acetylase OafA/YrhL